VAAFVEAHVGTGADGQAVFRITMTPRDADQFAALMRMNIDRQISVVLDGKMISGGLIRAANLPAAALKSMAATPMLRRTGLLPNERQRRKLHDDRMRATLAQLPQPEAA
jgi:hypothetical protein